MNATPSLRLNSNINNWKRPVQRTDPLDNLVPNEFVKLMVTTRHSARIDRKFRRLGTPSRKVSFDAESKATSLPDFFEARIGVADGIKAREIAC